MNVLGVDASDNIAQIAREKGIETITGFFGRDISKKIVNDKGENASVITATNVFAHINDYDDFIEGMKNLLSKDGIFVFSSSLFFGSC